MTGALIGALRVSLSAETSAFEAGMKRAQKTAQSTASKIKGSFGSIGGEFGLLSKGVAGFVAALSVGTILAAGKAALEYAGSLAEVAQQLGVTAKDLQVLRYAAGQVGVSQEQLETGLSKLTITLGKVAAGAEAPAKALKAIGISAEDLKGKDTGEAFRIIADGLEKVTDRSQRAAVEVALFGKSGSSLDNLLSGGSKAVNELAKAAEELGIVLSDEQIQKADDTADKLEALQTVLKAQIAGAVADNADAILGLANAFAEAGREAAQAIKWVRGFYDEAVIASKQLSNFLSERIDKGFLGDFGIGNQTRAANRAANDREIAAIRSRQADKRFGSLFRGRPKTKGGGGADIDKFLASGGGKHKASKAREDHSAERALRDQNQFDQDIRRANIDILNAKKDLATDAVEQYTISIQIKDAEKAAFEAQLAYEVKLNELSKGQDGITAAQAEQLQAQYDIRDGLERQKLVSDESERARKASSEVDMNVLEMERDYLQSQAQLAETASERRKIQLRILDNAYAIEKASLEEVIASRDATEAQKEIARQRLLQLNRTYKNDRQSVVQGTRGPLEDYFSQLPLDAEKYNEALEKVAAGGLQSLEEGLLDVITGTKSLKSAFHDMAAAILADLLKIAIQKYIIGTIMQAAGIGGAANGGPVGSFAYGGFVSGPGGSREDRVPAMLSNGEFVINAKSTKKFLPLLEAINNGVPHMAMGGLAIARPSIGPRIDVSNDNHGMGRMPPIVMNNDFRGADPAAVAAITMKLNKMEAEFPGRVVATMSDAKDRFIWRGDRR